MKNSSINRNYEISFVTISSFLAVYLSSSFSLSVYIGTVRLLMFLGFFIFLLIGTILNGSTIIKLPNRLVVLALIIALFSYLINGESLKSITILISYYILVILFVGIIDIGDWIEAYNNIICIIASASLAIYILSFVAPNIISYLPSVRNSIGVYSKSIFLSIAPLQNRNYGPFWEPGAYQIYLNLALMIELLNFKAERYIRIIILVVTVITTFSTAGYVTMIAVIITAIISGIIDKKISKRVGFITIGISIIAILLFNRMIKYFPSLYLTVIGKVINYVANPTQNTSTGVRVESFIQSFKIFFHNPLFGVGLTKLNNIFMSMYSNNMTTCTYANWFAMFGIFYAIIMLMGLYKFTAIFTKKKVIMFCSFITILLSITSEDMVLDPSFLIIIVYGLSIKKVKN